MFREFIRESLLIIFTVISKAKVLSNCFDFGIGLTGSKINKVWQIWIKRHILVCLISVFKSLSDLYVKRTFIYWHRLWKKRWLLQDVVINFMFWMLLVFCPITTLYQLISSRHVDLLYILEIQVQVCWFLISDLQLLRSLKVLILSLTSSNNDTSIVLIHILSQIGSFYRVIAHCYW